jgi:hypothetical protein
MIVPFAKPDSIDLTIQSQNNLLHTPPILSEIPHAVSAISDPTNTQRQVATSTLAQYTILSPYSCLPSSSQFLMLPRFDFESISITTHLFAHELVISNVLHLISHPIVQNPLVFITIPFILVYTPFISYLAEVI